MKNKKFKIFGIKFEYFSLCIVAVLLFIGAIIYTHTSSFVIPEADTIYDSDSNWEGTLEINENKTVKISGITHSNQGTVYGSAIKISGNSTVNLIFEGENILSGNSEITSAGIEVKEGSTVNIYGIDGNNLTVTGGKYSAGIGGIGYGSVSANNPKSGNIFIYSGNITAIGGDKGAGIGSGYHSSASNIEIKGGNIIALGTGSGAGIGSGYGTSGGAAEAAGVGFYNGGNITISGGTIKAAAYHINFDNFDPYNTETLYSEGYSNTHAAGIGGGYGASSGVVIVEGDANVTAIGASGGAGIGSGRGTSKPANYDAANFNVDITIKDNSKVIAMATNDTRSGQTPEGGAAIGLGRGCTIKGDPKGSVTIGGNANVYAVGPYYAQAIGGSRTVGSTVLDAHLASIDLENTTLIMAVSDGQRDAIDYIDESNLTNFITLNFSDEYFENQKYFFTEDKFPLKIAAIDPDNTNSKKVFSIQNPTKHSFMVSISGAKKYSFVAEDYHGENNETICISNSVEENSAEFFPDSTAIKRYDATSLTARLDSEGSVDFDYGNLKLKISAKEGIFEYGSSFFCDRIEDKDIINELNANLDKKYSDKLERILYFDIGVKNRKGEKYSDFTGGKVKIYVEVPAGWDKNEALALFITSAEDEDFKDTQKLEVIDGITYLSFETDHFSRYALFDPIIEIPSKDNPTKEYNIENEGNNESESQGENESSNEEENENKNLPTGDNIYFIFIIFILALSGSLIGLILFRKKNSRKNSKNNL